jgi:hypothetical protein
MIGVRCQCSAQPPAKKRLVKSQKKLPKLIVLLLNVGAVFNRDLEIWYHNCIAEDVAAGFIPAKRPVVRAGSGEDEPRPDF